MLIKYTRSCGRSFVTKRGFSTWEFIARMSRVNQSNAKWQQFDERNAASKGTDGFQTVAHRKPMPSSISKGPIPYRGGPQAGRSKPGVAKSYYKEELLPVAEQNPVRLEAQKSKSYPKTTFRVGTIVRTPINEQDVYASKKPRDNTISESHYGRIHTKFRKMIIIGLYDVHYVAIPVYTHEGRGLELKEKKDEFISIQDHRQEPPSVQRQSRLGILKTEKLYPDVSPYHPKSTAHITAPHSRKYEGQCIIEGCIAPKSVTLLLELYEQRIPKP